MSFHDMGLYDKKIEEDSIDNDAKDTSVLNLNSSMEVKIKNIRCNFKIHSIFCFQISSDCFIPIESTDSTNHTLTGGVTIIHEDTVF